MSTTISTEPALTLEDIWKLFRETDRLFREGQQESERRFQETEQLLKQQSQETDRRFQETDRKFQETDRKFQETDRKIKEVSIQIGRLGNRLGDFVEEMVRPALVRVFQQRGIEVHQVLQNLIAYNDQHRMQSQVDLLAVDTNVAVAVECKSHLSVEDVNEHLQRLAAFKTYFPQYAHLHLQGAVAAMVLPENVGEYAMRKGLYILSQSGEAIVIHNALTFEPRYW